MKKPQQVARKSNGPTKSSTIRFPLMISQILELGRHLRLRSQCQSSQQRLP